MKIALVSSQRRGAIDQLLSDVADRLQSGEATLAGIVRVQGHVSAFDNGCDMKVRVLPDGPVVDITQALGKGSDACRLDPGAIADAVSHVERGSLRGADLFILNKFGPEEASGRGFCAVIGKALEYGIPVLVGVGDANRQAFDAFAGGMAEALPDNLHAIHNWCLSAIAEKPSADHTATA